MSTAWAPVRRNFSGFPTRGAPDRSEARAQLVCVCRTEGEAGRRRRMNSAAARGRGVATGRRMGGRFFPGRGFDVAFGGWAGYFADRL